MSTYVQTLRYLFGLQHRGIKFGLRNTLALLAAVGNPERSFPSIHIAGTNGKGSTASFLSSISMEGGYRTGLYTSPHLVDFTERIRVNGTRISRGDVVRYTRLLRPTIERLKATFFEATTCIAFMYFAERKIELAVIETGLGGRLDSTNVVQPLASVITGIGLDHTHHLGSTIQSIAAEKGGIIKEGIPCITGTTDPVALEVLRRIAQQQKTHLHESRRMVKTSAGIGSHSVSLSSNSIRIKSARLGLIGPHQIRNAQTAVAACDVLMRDKEVSSRFPEFASATTIKRGLANVVRNSGLHGRLETISGKRRYILDVAHNPQGISTLVQALTGMSSGKFVVVFGALEDKDVEGMLKSLAPITRLLVAVSARSPRAMKAARIRPIASNLGISAMVSGGISRALAKATSQTSTHEPVLITGSHYIVGEAYPIIARKRKP